MASFRETPQGRGFANRLHRFLENPEQAHEEYRTYTRKDISKDLEAQSIGKDIRDTLYEKELYLKAELVKKDPDAEKALSLQNDISEAEGKFNQNINEHLLRMKKNQSGSRNGIG